MVIEGENDNAQCPYKIYKIVNKNNQIVGTAGLNGTWILDGDILPDYTGQKLKAEVGFDPSINNVCWGNHT